MQGANQAIIQDMQILRKSQNVVSSVSKVECYVCGKGLEDGHSITAKTLPHGIVLFCDVHYSLFIAIIDQNGLENIGIIPLFLCFKFT